MAPIWARCLPIWTPIKQRELFTHSLYREGQAGVEGARSENPPNSIGASSGSLRVVTRAFAGQSRQQSLRVRTGRLYLLLRKT
jgi:hypothetical protein